MAGATEGPRRGGGDGAQGRGAEEARRSVLEEPKCGVQAAAAGAERGQAWASGPATRRRAGNGAPGGDEGAGGTV